MTIMKTLKIEFHYVIACFVSILCNAQADYIFSPPPEARNITSPNALLVTESGASSIRIQEVHRASDFVDPDGLILMITGISYSAPSWSGRVPIDVTLPNIEIRMSTTLKNPDALSMSFADNIGSDETVVYSGPLRLYETELESYDIHIPIIPFYYTPAGGNLLIDTFNYDTIPSRVDPDWTLDAVDRFSDSVSLVSSGSSGVTSPSGGFSTAGFMIRFTYTPVPEPGTLTILVIGLVSFGVAAFNRKRK